MYQSFDIGPAIAASPRIQFSGHRFAARPLARTSLFDLPLISGTREQTAEYLAYCAEEGRRKTVAFVNAHCINVAAGDRDYRRALESCDLLLPDGSGMRLAARLSGVAYADNLNGTDLFPLLCAQAAWKGLSIYLLGGVDGVADAAAEAMCQRYPGLRIAGTHHGYFDRNDSAAIIEHVNESGADILFVGFGVPLQECWLHRHGSQIEASVQLSVGGLFDYYSGRIPRAPLPVRAAGCEWIWRLAQEPRRLAHRYLLGTAAFVARAAATALDGRTAGRFGNALKRVVDIAASALAIAVLSPLLLAIALGIKLEDQGPALFVQTRIGRGGRPFRVLKFRSMVTDAEKLRLDLLVQSERDGVCFKMKRDPRITRVGRLLRKTSLDELPQLFNVLRGEMSIVGPRPALPQEVSAYWPRAMRRLDALPGITCIWQVSGRAEIPFTEQVEMDIDYVESNGLLRDISIMAKTVPAVLAARGAY